MVYDRRVSKNPQKIAKIHLRIDGRKDLHSENHNTLDDEENTVNVEHYHLDGEHSMVLTMVIPLVMVILIAVEIGDIIGDSASATNLPV